MSKTLSVTNARKELLELVDEVHDSYSRVDITKNGEVKAVLIDPEYLDSLEETIYTLEHSMDDIRESEAEIARGEYVTLAEIKERLGIDDSKSPDGQ